MVTTTLNLISKQTVGADGASSVTFSNIPQTYTDLLIVASGRTNRGTFTADTLTPVFNGSTANFTTRVLSGDGSSASSNTSYINAFDTNVATASTFGNTSILIPNYTSSNYKSISVDGVAETNGTTAYMSLAAGLWSSTAAITSFGLQSGTSSTFQQFSTFYLYGVSNSSTQNASVPYASGGDVITTDGTYWYHAFKYSGTFTPLKALSCDVLVVAGGGGGGGQNGGGGGSGGALGFASQNLASGTGYTVTVGGGGAGSTAQLSQGTSGSNSTFGSLTTASGGGGGAYQTGASGTGKNGLSGGSGGGGACNSGTGRTASQGYAGGSGSASAGAGGGGGGMGSTGTAGQSSSPYGAGPGGSGINTITNFSNLGTALTATSLGVSGYIAGGGGGGGGNSQINYGGSGGGGNGYYGYPSFVSAATSGSANSGSGGGGGGDWVSGGTYSGASGGSGVIIVRYAV